MDAVTDAETAARLERERDFHNNRFGATEARKEDSFYFALTHGASRYWDEVKLASLGCDVLEYGCASGGNSIALAPGAESVAGIDISDVAIAQATGEAAARGLGNTRFAVEDAEHMSFPDASFDVVFGSGILHHLDLDASFRELNRVMRPGATALFWEPLGHNAAINAYRNRTPHARTEDEHPLLKSDFDLVRRYFRSTDLEFFGLFTLAAIPFRNSAAGGVVRAVGEAIDNVVLKIPSLQWQAWYVLIRLTR